MNLPSSSLVQRVVGAAWLGAVLLLASIAWAYRAQYAYEPVGPRAFPLLCLGLMALGLAAWLLRPPPIERDADDPPLDARLLRKVAACIGLLLGYAALFEPLGFILASTLAGALVARLYGGRWVGSAVTGLAIGIGLYVLFDRVLEVPLPAGVLAPLLS